MKSSLHGLFTIVMGRHVEPPLEFRKDKFTLHSRFEKHILNGMYS